MRHVTRPDGMPPVNGYSHVVAAAGTLVAVSGQVPMDADGQVVGEDDAAAQVRQVFVNLRTALDAAGASLADVIKLTVFLTDLADLPAFRAARDEFLDPERLPACSLVRVAGLVHPAFRVEIDALAVTS
ncbi:RidA family protein [Streptomyces sp. PTM05]|uniref:RidA family protein n=1 Tax=Streptantibioticus parmotrematis TaxID=2873249 RepID=A0ABS7QQR7_9ACTN|nr:RidA family protein [Streptantibioticus parmotrematis]MBY8885536.1 RidA family protein [Streptantibioticus parmotrematis]